ncbi:uncharacterized protein LTHEOB_8477 [Lasiodiplodia theobromae]|uniref:uncharacterized protein n=1 Tax=Lasiodiplodia theobromae TaxID=45133 RepID=UPI0015C2EF42|nr:uncharacterized protein LTHEOB_8477 [Lasiodiplodia theobromae]KAF4541482.1 hypothetical protein LTHEOB_8477 [Lasiodiplodia theobromae]
MMMLHLVGALALACFATGFVFQPDHHSTYLNSRVPARFDLSKDQADGSYWSSTFLTTTTGKQYLAVSHVLGSLGKSSILELDTLRYWNDLAYSESSDSNTTPNSSAFSIRAGDYGFGSESADGISTMYTFGSSANYSYNFGLEASSKVLLNGGGGAITFGSGYANSTEWAIPACKTGGTLTLEDEILQIDPAKSLTWYDHQKGFGAPRNWTWFELHFPDSSIKASIWAYDLLASPSAEARFATVRVGQDSHSLLAYELTPDMGDVWKSPNSNITYPLKWKLDFENGDYLWVKSIRPDQEIYGSRQIGDTVYAGFATVSGRFLGQKRGFGVVEMITLY